jgi:cytochrome c5
MKVAAWIVALAWLVAAQAVTTQGAMAQTRVSIWSGVYTDAQNKRGEQFYSGACKHCHGVRLNGAAAPDQPPSPARGFPS